MYSAKCILEREDSFSCKRTVTPKCILEREDVIYVGKQAQHIDQHIGCFWQQNSCSKVYSREAHELQIGPRTSDWMFLATELLLQNVF